MTVHVCRDGHEMGQYTTQVFNNLVENGQLFPTDHFWVDGMSDWKPRTLAKSYFGHRESAVTAGQDDRAKAGDGRSAKGIDEMRVSKMRTHRISRAVVTLLAGANCRRPREGHA